jgi:hypothetical protein
MVRIFDAGIDLGIDATLLEAHVVYRIPPA